MMKLLVGITLLFASLCALGAKPQTTISATDQRVSAIAAKSTCAKYKWRDRGHAPIGYIKGMALMYAKSFCESRSTPGPVVSAMKQPLMGGEDALVRYRADLARNGVDVGNDIERLRAIYTLAIGQGMRESSGNTTEGRDKKVKHPTTDNAETGLFQQSFDSFRRSPLFGPLMDHYRANTSECRLTTFMEGVTEIITTPVVPGRGAEFQRFTRECPACATEYAMILFRINQTHFGPIKNHEAEYYQPCNAMLKEVEAVASCTP